MSSQEDRPGVAERLDAIGDLKRWKPSVDWKDIGKAAKGLPWGRWTHQYDAFQFVLRYLDHCERRKDTQKRAPKSALIRMPTGTGKTGIMCLTAGYAEAIDKNKIILVIVPSYALRLQVREAIEWRFWKVVGKRPVNWRPAEDFTPSTLADALASTYYSDWEGDKKKPVLVCTTTTIAMLSGDAKRTNHQELQDLSQEDLTDADEEEERADWGALYRRLLSITGLVLVDEGHREPAPTWARAIRRFRCPRILFSATPYRNDLRLFDIGRERGLEESTASPTDEESRRAQRRAKDLGVYRFIYQFNDARDSGVIRDVSFAFPDSGGGWTYSQRGELLKRKTQVTRFAAALTEFYQGQTLKRLTRWCKRQKENENLQTDRPLWPPKVIVRCASFNAVQNVKRALERKMSPGEVIAIHTRFSGAESSEHVYRQVPDLSSEAAKKAIFWVHQDMLVEGLDHPGFWIVAFFEKFGNERALIQQVGRVLREPTGVGKNVPAAIVFSDPAQQLQDSWDGYRGYEDEEPPIVGPEEIIERFLKALPKYFYSRGAYRQTIQIADEDAEAQLLNELRLPCRANILGLNDNVPLTETDLDELVEDIADRLEQRDYTTVQVLKPGDSPGMRVMVILQVSESLRVTPSNFFDIRMQPAALLLVGDYLFWQGPIDIDSAAGEYGYGHIDAAQIRSLLGKQAIVRQTSTLNTDLNDGAIRRKAIGAMDLAQSGVALGDEGHAMVTVVATNGAMRRQLNLMRGRVSEVNLSLESPKGFADWANKIAAELGKDVNAYPPMLDRFACEVHAPDEAEAAHVLIDPRLFKEHYNLNSDSPAARGDPAPFEELLEASAVSLERNRDIFTAHLGNSESGFPITAQFRIAYRKGRFRITPTNHEEFLASFERLFRKREDSTTDWKPETLLTSKASIQIVTRSGLMYTGGRFFEPRRLWGSNRAAQLPEIHGCKSLAIVAKGEKGFVTEVASDGSRRRRLVVSKHRSKASWDKQCLFGMVDRERSEIYRQTKFKPNWLVCDDMGSEYADFIALDDSNPTSPRLAMIHCKMGDSHSRTSTSAGDLHVVVSQANKNLGLFSLNTGMLNERAIKWDGHFHNHKGLSLIRRSGQAKKRTTGARFVQRLVDALGKTNVRREVWLVMGTSVSAGSIKTAAESSQQPSAHVIHLLYLLQSAQANANSLGIQLRLLTKP